MGKFLLSTLMLLATVFASTAADNLTLLTDVPADGQPFFLWGSNKYSGSFREGGTGSGALTDGYIPAVILKSDASSLSVPESLSIEDPTKVAYMAFESYNNAKILKFVSGNYDGKYLKAGTKNNTLSVVDTPSEASTVTVTIASTGAATIKIDDKVYLKYNATSASAARVTCYTGSTTGSAYLFGASFIPTKCATPVAMINDKAVVHGDKVVVDDELSFSCSTEGATISYTVTGGSYNGETQTYNGTPIKLDKIGIYTITAKATKDGMDASNELKIEDIDVVGKTPKMAFANASVYGKVNTGVVWQQVVVTEPSENAGVITYSSSNSEVVSVDAATGRIYPADVKKAGVATITAAMEAKGDYAEGTASYLIVVIDPNAQIQPDHTVFDFTTEDPYGMTTQNGGSAYEQNIKSIPGENETVTLSFTGNYRSYNSSTAPYHLRLQKGAKLTITVPEGYKITKIGITGSNIRGTYDPASGTNADLTDPDGGTFSYVWIPQETAGAVRSITYTSPSGSNADPTQIKKINVMWDAADSELKPVQLTFTPNVNGIYVNEEAEINAANNEFGREIEYSISGLVKDTDYTITPAEDGKTLRVLVNKPGSYTLEARSAAGDGFRDGFAIMRLNVYRHLSVYANGEAIVEDVINTGSGNTNVTIDVPENANLYYRLENTPTPEAVAAEESGDENMLDGYTFYEDGITIPAKTAGALNFYIANYGYLSPIRKITLSFETGIEEIENVANGAVRTFDLNGREIKGTPEKGIYVRVVNGKASKVIL